MTTAGNKIVQTDLRGPITLGRPTMSNPTMTENSNLAVARTSTDKTDLRDCLTLTRLATCNLAVTGCNTHRPDLRDKYCCITSPPYINDNLAMGHKNNNSGLHALHNIHLAEDSNTPTPYVS